MNDVELLRSVVDSLDSGLPDRPDLGAIRSVGRRQRRRRAAWAGGACAAVTALAVPVGLVVLGAGGHPAHRDTAADPTSVAHRAATAGPDFGVDFRAAVQQAVPSAQYQSQELGDGWRFDPDKNIWDWSVHDPVHWSTLFGWAQFYTLPGGGELAVNATWTSPDSVLAVGQPFSCDDDEPSGETRVSCTTTDRGGLEVTVEDGVRDPQAVHGPGHPHVWSRYVEVRYPDSSHGSAAVVTIVAFTDATVWDQASRELPSVDALASLGADPALELPAPEPYPVPADLAQHSGS